MHTLLYGLTALTFLVGSQAVGPHARPTSAEYGYLLDRPALDRGDRLIIAERCRGAVLETPVFRRRC